MATIETGTFGSWSSPQLQIDYWVNWENDSQVNIGCTAYYTVHGYAAYTNGAGRAWHIYIDGAEVGSGSLNINGVSSNVTLGSWSRTVNKTTGGRNVGVSGSFYFDVNWSGSYAGTLSCYGNQWIGAKTSYTISYNANGGSGAPSSQTKWYGETLKLSSTKPTRTGYSFAGWATSASGSVAYAAGANYTANAAVTLYAKWTANTYAVKYNANGGSGAPAQQTKTYGVTLKLSTTKPTRTNYNFLGWGTSASSTTVAYAAGANYTANAAITLYAIWEIAYTPPKITSVTVDRCNSSGTITDEGTYVKVAFSWSVDSVYSAGVSSITIGYKLSTATSYTNTTVSASGKSGTVSKIIGGGAINTEYQYDVRITVTDNKGNSYLERVVAPMQYIIDFKSGGKGVAIGKPASNTGFEIAWPTTFEGGIRPVAIPKNADLNDYTTPGFYYCAENATVATFANCPTGKSFTLEVIRSAGIVQRLTEYHSGDTGGNLPRVFYRGNYGWPDLIWHSWVKHPYPAYMDEHIRLQNNIAITGRTTGGSDSVILRMNTSNQVELTWTSGGLKGRVWKQLWSGSMAVGGSATVADFPYYNVFAVEYAFDYSGTYYISAVGCRAPDNPQGLVRFVNFVDVGNGSIITSVNANIVGTKFTLSRLANYHINNACQYLGSGQVKRIYGLL